MILCTLSNWIKYGTSYYWYYIIFHIILSSNPNINLYKIYIKLVKN